MKAAFVLLLALSLTVLSFASELKTAKIVSVKNYEQGRIAYWEGNMPIYDGFPVYDITMEVDKKLYIVRYESFTGFYPRAWRAGNEIQVKKERGQFILKDGEEEVTARTVSEYDCVSSNRPHIWTSDSRLPCE